MGDPRERRKLKRVQAPVQWRFVSTSPLVDHESSGATLWVVSDYATAGPLDISVGGMRVDSEEALTPGQTLGVELLLPDKSMVLCKVEVAWSEPTPAGPTKHQAGFRFLELDDRDSIRLAAVLDPTR